MCFCRPNLERLFAKYADIHPEDVLEAETLWTWVERKLKTRSPRGSDTATMLALAELQLIDELPSISCGATHALPLIRRGVLS